MSDEKIKLSSKPTSIFDKDNDYIVGIKENGDIVKFSGSEVGGGTGATSVPKATYAALGGIKANTKTSADTVPVNIDNNGFLWTKPASTSSVDYEMVVLSPSGDTTGATDYSNISSAINGFEKGGKVLLTVGTFYINEALELKDNVVLSGISRGEALSPSDVDSHYGTTIMVVGDKDAIHLFHNGATVEHLQIIGSNSKAYLGANEAITLGNMAGNAGYSGFGIVYGHDTFTEETLNCTVNDVQIQRCYKAALVLMTNTWCSVFSSIHIQRCGVGILGMNLSSDNFFDNFKIENCGSGMVLCGHGSSRFNNFKIYDNGTAGSVKPVTSGNKTYGLYMSGASNNMMNNIELQENKGVGLHMDHCNWNSITNLHVDRGTLGVNDTILAESYSVEILGESLRNQIYMVSTKLKKGLLIDNTSNKNKIIATCSYLVPKSNPLPNEEPYDEYDAEITNNGTNTLL